MSDDPTLTPVNCAGSTCSVELGRDTNAVDAQGPSALRGVVRHDDTLDCDTGVGLHVQRCNPPADLTDAETPGDVDSGNALRRVENCGLIVVPPLIINRGNGTPRNIPATGESGVSHSFNHTNNDVVDQLVTLTCKPRIVCEKNVGSGTESLLIVDVRVKPNLPQVIAQSQTDINVTLSSSGGLGQNMLDSRHITHAWIVAPGQTLDVDYVTNTLSKINVDANPALTPDFGFTIRQLFARVEQVRSS